MLDVAEVQQLQRSASIFEVAAQCEADARKSDVIPRDLGFLVQTGFKAFSADAVVTLDQVRAESHVYLSGMQHVRNRQQRADFDPRQGFLQRLARGSGLQGLAVFHKACRRGPVPATRHNRTAAQQNTTLPFGYAADHNARILVMNAAAGGAHRSRQIVAGWYAPLHRLTTVWTEFHSRFRYRTRTEGSSAAEIGEAVMPSLLKASWRNCQTQSTQHRPGLPI